jgi:hypothetical protein
MSRFLSEDDVTSITNYLSAPRLGTYLGLTKSKHTADAIELHQATMSLGIALMAVTGLIEVGLRNAACMHLDNVFGGGWLRTPPPSLKWSGLEKHAISKGVSSAQRALYSKMTGQEKIALDAIAFPRGLPAAVKHGKLAEKRQATISVSDGQLIAQLTLHYWKRLFSNDYEASLWKRGLKRAFPNKQLSRATVAEQLEVIYQSRNRLAHHEPVYGARLAAALSAVEFVSVNFESRYPSSESPFAKLIMPQRDILAGQVAIFRSTFDRLCA